MAGDKDADAARQAQMQADIAKMSQSPEEACEAMKGDDAAYKNCIAEKKKADDQMKENIEKKIDALPQPIRVTLKERLNNPDGFRTLNKAFFTHLSRKVGLRVFSGAVVRFAQQGQLDTQPDAVAEANAAAEAEPAPGMGDGGGEQNKQQQQQGGEKAESAGDSGGGADADGDGSVDLDEDEDDLATQNERISLLDIAEMHPGVHAYIEGTISHALVHEGKESVEASGEFMRRALLFLRDEVAEVQGGAETVADDKQAVYLQKTYEDGRKLMQRVVHEQSRLALETAATGRTIEVRYFEDKGAALELKASASLNGIETSLEDECDALNEKFAGMAHVLPGLLKTQVKSPEALLDLLEPDFGGRRQDEADKDEMKKSPTENARESDSVFSASKERVLRALRAVLHGVRERRAVLGRAVDGYLQGVAEPLFAAESREAADPAIPAASQKAEHRLATAVKVVKADRTVTQDHVLVKAQAWDGLKNDAHAGGLKAQQKREAAVRALQSMPYAIYVGNEAIYVGDELPQEQAEAGVDASNPF